MEATVLAILIALLIFAIAVWAIGVIPLPEGGPVSIKAVLYVAVAVLLIFYLLRFVR